MSLSGWDRHDIYSFSIVYKDAFTLRKCALKRVIPFKNHAISSDKLWE